MTKFNFCISCRAWSQTTADGTITYSHYPYCQIGYFSNELPMPGCLKCLQGFHCTKCRACRTNTPKTKDWPLESECPTCWYKIEAKMPGNLFNKDDVNQELREKAIRERAYSLWELSDKSQNAEHYWYEARREIDYEWSFARAFSPVSLG